MNNIAIDIDLNALIADPVGYLQNAEIDLGSIKNLTIRRKPIVQRGKSTFDTQSFIEEWNAYPESYAQGQGLGAHTNACVAAVVQWKLSEITVNEDDGTVQADIEVTGSQPDQVDGNFWDVTPPNQTSWAIEGPDFDAGPYGSFSIPPFSSQIVTVNVSDIVDDSQPEQTEWFALDIYNVNGATIGTNNVLTFKILDNDGLSVPDIAVGEQIMIFPTVFNGAFTISTEDPTMEIEVVTLIDVTGRSVVLYVGSGHSNEMRIPVDGLAAGYVTAVIRTNKGIAVKKLLNMNVSQ